VGQRHHELSQRRSARHQGRELAAEQRRLFDRAHFANPGVGTTGATFGTAAFGTISSTRLTSREAQVGLRLLF
jgi:hypothetical protein